MYGKARSAGHAGHAGHAAQAMVVGFPVALFTSTVAMLLAYLQGGDAFYYRGAMLADLAGVVTALIAMIPGAIDLIALPRPSPARDLARRHAMGVLLVTSVFAASSALLVHGWTTRVRVSGRWALDPTLPLALAVVGLVLLMGVALTSWSLAPAPLSRLVRRRHSR